MADHQLAPKFSKGQAVRISLHDSRGKVKDELARKALAYFAQTATVVSCAPYEMGKKVILVYKVKIEGGPTLQLTEDCLMPLKDA